MLKEMVIMAAFLFALSGVASGILVIQKTANAQTVKAECIMEYANETD